MVRWILGDSVQILQLLASAVLLAMVAAQVDAYLADDPEADEQDLEASRDMLAVLADHSAEIEAIQAALQSTNGRRAEAAEILGISRKTLWEKIKNLDISVDF